MQHYWIILGMAMLGAAQDRKRLLGRLQNLRRSYQRPVSKPRFPLDLCITLLFRTVGSEKKRGIELVTS